MFWLRVLETSTHGHLTLLLWSCGEAKHRAGDMEWRKLLISWQLGSKERQQRGLDSSCLVKSILTWLPTMRFHLFRVLLAPSSTTDRETFGGAFQIQTVAVTCEKVVNDSFRTCILLHGKILTCLLLVKGH